MKVCFVNPPRPWLVNPHAQAPIGILYLAAVLEVDAGIDVVVENLAGKPAGWDDVCGLPLADVYCLTGTWLDMPEVNALVATIRQRCHHARILVGGPIALSPGGISPHVELVVCGEAESNICALVAGTEDQSYSDYDGVYHCQPPQDLDTLPFPARHLWAGPFGGNIFIGGENYFGGGSTTILGSRGCPYDCAFCASSALAPRKVRLRSAESIVEEMEQCVVDYGVRQFRFSDENFNASERHVAELCEHILHSDIFGRGDKIAWRASIAVRPRSKDMFEIMATSGCREVSIGVESADPAVLAQLCPAKIKDPGESEATLRAAKAAGLKTRALMMVGTPGENANTARLNTAFFRTASYDALALAIFTPMPGSAIFDNPTRFGCRLLSTQHEEGQYLYGPAGRCPVEPRIEVEGFSLEELRASMLAQVEAAEATGKVGRG